MDTRRIVKKFNNLVRKKGITSYLNKWKPITVIPKTESELVDAIKSSLKTYHFHSFLYYNVTTSVYKSDMKLPEFYFSNKIGRIVFYSFIYYNKNQAKEIEKKIIKQVNQVLDGWEKKGMKGLIVDFRNHYGGDFWPVVHCFKRFFNNSTLLAFSSVKEKWVNLESGKIRYNRPYLKRESYKLPIAVVIGSNTGSSGEFAALLFRGTNNCKFFGEETAGYLSSNETFSLTSTIKVILTTSLVIGPDKVLYENQLLIPDVVTKQPITDCKKWIKNCIKRSR